jgi:tetratricopeptide (TPR) repeat protein
MKETTRTEGTVSSRALELAEEIRQTGRRSPQELVPLIDQAEKLAHDADNPFTRGVSVRAAGSAHQMLNNFSAALDRYESAARYFSEAGDSAQVGRTLLAKVGPLANRGKLKELFECAKDARELFQTHGDDASLAHLNVNLGNAYFRMDRFHEALGCYEDAFPTLEELKDNEAYLAASLNAAVVLTTLHRFDDADHRYDRAEAVAAELGMRTIEQQCPYNRTYLDYLRGNSGAALKEIQRLRPGFEQSADDQHLCQCWLDEAEILLEIGDLPEAAESARTARDLAQKLTLNYEFGKSLVFEAIARLRKGDDQAAHTMLRDAIRRFEAEGNNVWTAVSQLQTALFPDAEGVQQALRHATAARQTLNDSSLLHRVAFADIVIGRLSGLRANCNSLSIRSDQRPRSPNSAARAGCSSTPVTNWVPAFLHTVTTRAWFIFGRLRRFSTRCGTASARTI